MRKFEAMAFGVLLFFVVPAFAAGSVGKVTYIKGEAWLARGDSRLDVALNTEVLPGDSVVTEGAGRVRLGMADNSVIYVGSHSRVVIKTYKTGKKGDLKKGAFNILWGKARFLVTKVTSGMQDFSVRTTTATMGVRGTQFAVSIPRPKNVPAKVGPVMPPDVKPAPMPTNVMLFEGALVGTNVKGVSLAIEPGMHARFDPSGYVIKRPIRPSDVANLGIPVLVRPKAEGSVAAPPLKGGAPSAGAPPVGAPQPEGSSSPDTGKAAPMPAAPGMMAPGGASMPAPVAPIAPVLLPQPPLPQPPLPPPPLPPPTDLIGA